MPIRSGEHKPVSKGEIAGKLAAQPSEHDGWRRAVSFFSKLSILPILIPLWIVFAILSPNFATVANAQTLLAATAVMATAAVGETLVLLTAGIDISAGTVVSASAVIGATAMAHTGDPFIGLVVAVGVGLAFGLFNGFSVAVLGLTPFVLTIGTYLIARGIAFSISQGIAVPGTPEAVANLGTTEVLGIPAIALIAIAVMVIFGLLLSQTTWGRDIYLLGSNEPAAKYVGIRRILVKWSVYTIASTLSGLAGFLSIANLGVAIPGVGDTILLPVIGGVILGGTSLFGGEGSMWRTALGVLLLASLTNGLNLLGFAFYDQLIGLGIVIIAGTGMMVRFSQSR
jgi:ribose/xylose/arabinose/galactoside ABC-type transport system permease subunit